VYGQLGSFTTNTLNKGGAVSADTLNGPTAIALDAAENIYICDSNNNRVLFYSGTSTTATRVYGQADFTTKAGGVSATALNSPQGIAVSSGGVYISEVNNNRVLYSLASPRLSAALRCAVNYDHRTLTESVCL
jgi:hypothetical protein